MWSQQVDATPSNVNLLCKGGVYGPRETGGAATQKAEIWSRWRAGQSLHEIGRALLRGSQGQRLRAIATTGDQSHRTAKAIAWLRANFTKPLHVEDLAAAAGIGVSTLHHHFRALTAMSPLQYQKRLRLQVARQRMLMDNLDAANAAFEVGYKSASQFNREYRRLFGQPPIRDIKVLRSANIVGTSVI